MLLIALPRILFVVSLHGENIFLSLVCFVTLDQIPKIKICHMVASEYTEVIEGRQRLISTDVPDSEEAYDDCFIDNYGYTLD